MKKLLEDWPFILFLIIVGIVGFYFISLIGNAWNSADRDFYCGENPELCK